MSKADPISSATCVATRIPTKRELKEVGSGLDFEDIAGVATRIPTKRELKDVIIAGGEDAGDLRCNAHPDEKGTERTGRTLSVEAMAPPRCNAHPDEKGTESRVIGEWINRAALGCNAHPDEKGTERSTHGMPSGASMNVATRIPTKRELKEDEGGASSQMLHTVATRIPTKRELKGSCRWWETLPDGVLQRASRRKGN